MRVAVIGATGHTGRLLVAALAARGVDVLACGRNLTALDALVANHPRVTSRVVEATRATQVEGALRDVDAVANLAGPFLDTGMTVVDAAIARGIPYVDTTGEQAFMQSTRTAAHERALAAGSPVVQALAFEYAFADLATRHLFPGGGDALHVLYRPRGAQASAGTKKSMVRILGAPSLGYEAGRLVRSHVAEHRRKFATIDGVRDAMSFPGGEILTVPWHTPFRRVRTYFTAKPATARLVGVLAPMGPRVLRGSILRAAERAIDKRHQVPQNAGARGEIYLVAEGPDGARHALVTTPDPYLATAELCAEGMLRLISTRRGGVLAPAEAFDATQLLATLGARMPGLGVTMLDISTAGQASRRVGRDGDRV